MCIKKESVLDIVFWFLWSLFTKGLKMRVREVLQVVRISL